MNNIFFDAIRFLCYFSTFLNYWKWFFKRIFLIDLRKKDVSFLFCLLCSIIIFLFCLLWLLLLFEDIFARILEILWGSKSKQNEHLSRTWVCFMMLKSYPFNVGTFGFDFLFFSSSLKPRKSGKSRRLLISLIWPLNFWCLEFFSKL